jgi:poly(hydroxyalkanoate) depolymerase family esterase
MPLYFSCEVDGRLSELSEFGSNPGALIARSYIPLSIRRDAPLVVVLHGCTQSATSYNRGAGWISAADEHGLALLFPEQQQANNPNLCFNWFSPADAGRGRGEALSIVQMVKSLCSRHALDGRRVYITGLSAGGAMAAAMLATYPDVFAGGAVIAGLPFGTANSVVEAFERMRGQPEPEAERLSGLVRAASNLSVTWPVLSVWHGTDDATVDASNAKSLVAQWRGLHGVPPAPSTTEDFGGHLRRAWSDEKGVEVIEEYVIRNMGHGTPIDAKQVGWEELAGPYMLDVGLSSTRRVLRFWGLDMGGKSANAAIPRSCSKPMTLTQPTPDHNTERLLSRPSSTGRAREVIEEALRRAGLMS